MSPARIALLLLFLSATTLLPAQPSPTATAPQPPLDSTQPIPTIHVTSRLVELDVVVTDAAGNPVKGLKPSDFALSEDGVHQPLANITEHDETTNVPAKPAPAAPPNTFAVQPPPPESVTKTVIFLDNLTYPNYPYVRADIATFMKTLPPGNPICIIRFDWHGLHLVQDFTSDPDLLQQVVAGPRMFPPPASIHPSASPFDAPPYYGVTNPYQRFARFLDGIPGRINLAWVTDEGAPASLIGPESQAYSNIVTFAGDISRSTRVLRLGRITFYAIKAGGYIGGILQPLHAPDLVAYSSSQDPTSPGMAVSLGGQIIDTTTPDIVFSQVPGTISLLPGDPVLMPPAGGSLLANQALADLATSMGGHAFFDGANKALSKIIAIGSDYYTLSYVPTNANWNGKFRKIEIHVSGIPPAGKSGLIWTAYGQPLLTYRHGYYARTTPQPLPGSPGFGLNDSPALSAAPPSPIPDNTAFPAAATPAVVARGPATPLDVAMGFGTLVPTQINFTIAVTPSAETEKPKPGASPAKDNFLNAAFHTAAYRTYRIHYWIDPADLKFVRSDRSFRDDLQFVAILYGDDGFAVNSISTRAHIQFPATSLSQIMASGIVYDQTVAIPVTGNDTASNFYLRVGVNETSTSRIGALEIPVESIHLPSAQTLAAAPKQ
jgi:VWFA-related protein